MLLQQNSAVAYGQTVIFAIKCNVNDVLILHGHLLVMLVSASLLFALCFQLHCKYWLKAIVIPVYIQIVLNKWLAMLQYPFVSVAIIWLETPITMEHYPISPASIMIPRTILEP